MRTLVIGAGVIGRVYAGRLAATGAEVHLLARGRTLSLLAGHDLTLHSPGASLEVPVTVVEAPEGRYDTVLVAVRRDQIDSVPEQLSCIEFEQVVTLCNYPLGLSGLRARLGGERMLAGFPGVGGRLRPDGGVDYLQIRQQPTTLERRGGQENAIAESLRHAGFTVATTGRMDDWLATHAVFVVAICAALERAGFSATTLAQDHAALRTLARAVRSGFLGLRERGVTTTPRALAVLFTRVPTAAAAAYWSRQLRGPLGTIAFEPHARAALHTEIPTLRADLATLLPPDTAPEFDAFLRH
ncbi:hypothetical protein GPX89_13820 [Nocardia sp. ET3-3]|uniref:Ketopantoate reductase N-terminal domain-containing protein n=1 Tax=Nocardia terrae TaxID=2675851 RepID=A0A7K1UWT8_9NOCA|nr:2-dehydropantoate 2-reductase N-terminal domain-containing protein [Nocardia terrae]MVU78318.1 hypothetical protein [Nocardia terrae]